MGPTAVWTERVVIELAAAPRQAAAHTGSSERLPKLHWTHPPLKAAGRVYSSRSLTPLPHSAPTIHRRSELNTLWKSLINGKHSWQAPDNWRGRVSNAQSSGMGIPHPRQVPGPGRLLAGSSPVFRSGGGSPFLSSRTPGAIPERTSDSAGEAFLFLSSTLVQHRICSFIYSFIQLFDKCFLSTRPCLGALGTPPENKQLWFLFSRQTATMTRATEGGTRSQQSWQGENC